MGNVTVSRCVDLCDKNKNNNTAPLTYQDLSDNELSSIGQELSEYNLEPVTVDDLILEHPTRYGSREHSEFASGLIKEFRDAYETKKPIRPQSTSSGSTALLSNGHCIQESREIHTYKKKINSKIKNVIIEFECHKKIDSTMIIPLINLENVLKIIQNYEEFMKESISKRELTTDCHRLLEKLCALSYQVNDFVCFFAILELWKYNLPPKVTYIEKKMIEILYSIDSNIKYKMNGIGSDYIIGRCLELMNYFQKKLPRLREKWLENCIDSSVPQCHVSTETYPWIRAIASRGYGVKTLSKDLGKLLQITDPIGFFNLNSKIAAKLYNPQNGMFVEVVCLTINVIPSNKKRKRIFFADSLERTKILEFHPNARPWLGVYGNNRKLFGSKNEGPQDLFLLQEAVSGLSLSAHEAKENISLPILKKVLNTILHVLRFAHSENIIHGNICPESIYTDTHSLTLETNFILSDWMIERGNLERVGTIDIIKIGDEERKLYRAPELKQKYVYERSSDIFALGMLVIHFLCPSEMKTLSKGVDLITEIPRKLSVLAREFCLQCLLKGRKERASAIHLLENPFLQNENDPEFIRCSRSAIVMDGRNGSKLEECFNIEGESIKTIEDLKTELSKNIVPVPFLYDSFNYKYITKKLNQLLLDIQKDEVVLKNTDNGYCRCIKLLELKLCTKINGEWYFLQQQKIDLPLNLMVQLKVRYHRYIIKIIKQSKKWEDEIRVTLQEELNIPEAPQKKYFNTIHSEESIEKIPHYLPGLDSIYHITTVSVDVDMIPVEMQKIFYIGLPEGKPFSNTTVNLLGKENIINYEWRHTKLKKLYFQKNNIQQKINIHDKWDNTVSTRTSSSQG